MKFFFILLWFATGPTFADVVFQQIVLREKSDSPLVFPAGVGSVTIDFSKGTVETKDATDAQAAAAFLRFLKAKHPVIALDAPYVRPTHMQIGDVLLRLDTKRVQWVGKQSTDAKTLAFWESVAGSKESVKP